MSGNDCLLEFLPAIFNLKFEICNPKRRAAAYLPVAEQGEKAGSRKVSVGELGFSSPL